MAKSVRHAGREAAANRAYWNGLAGDYQRLTRIACDSFHLGPLLPSAAALDLLPPALAGLRCLELGCGAGQNSIALALGGATCTALDISASQLAHGRALARQHGVRVTFRCLALEETARWPAGPFDFVHSTYALPFVEEPQAVIAAAAARLAPGGTLLLTTGHPLFAGEWLAIEEEGEGMFVRDYFCPPADVRFAAEGDLFVRARTYPLGQTVDWLRQAGLVLERLVEPAPLPIPTLSRAQRLRQVPYDSPAWRRLYPQLAKVPVVAVFLARRPAVGDPLIGGFGPGSER